MNSMGMTGRSTDGSCRLMIVRQFEWNQIMRPIIYRE